LGSRNSCGIFPEVIDFYQKNQTKLGRMVTHRFRVDEIEKAMNLIDAHGAEVMKVIVNF